MTIKKGTYAAYDSQAEHIALQREADPFFVEVCGEEFVVHRGVYRTSSDTQLMAESITIGPEETFLEIGAGCGAVSVLLAKKSAGGLAVDVNQLAVDNCLENAKLHGTDNLFFKLSYGFSDVTSTFDVIFCNPPYSNHDAKDEIERMFWDPENDLKRDFFADVKDYLKPGGRVYFGWADFEDIDTDLPFEMAQKYGFKLVNTHEKKHKGGLYTFYVLEFVAEDK